jgi:hypothetical protein
LKRFALIIATALLLTGCASAAPPIKPSQSALAPVADLKPWASVIAEQQAYLAKWKDGWDAKGCAATTVDDLGCGMETLTGTFVVTTVAISLRIPYTKTAKGYIGPVPTELTGIYGDTQKLADDAVAAGKAWTVTCNATPKAADCPTLTFQFGSTVDDLTTKFAAWAPYL